ncbi:MAG: hypothetical protein QW351_09260 [Candidatus Caldarchaeum sp.]
MDPIATLAAFMDMLYIVMLAQAVVMHAVGRHEKCKRNMFVVAMLGSMVLMTVTAKAGGELALVLQPLQTISLLSMVLGGLYVLASLLKTANDRAVQNIKAETESTEIENKHPASSAPRSITQLESTGEQISAQRYQALYTVSQKSLAASWRPASAAGQLDCGLYKAGQSAATSVSSKRRLDKKPGGGGEVARIEQDCSKILTIPMTTTTGSCLSASVSTNTPQTSAAVEKMHVEQQTGQKAQFSDQKSFEKVMRWLSRQRRLKQFGKGRPYIRRVRNVVRDRYYTLEICRLVARIMKQGFKHEGKTYQHNRFHLLASDLDIVWRISKDADPPPMTERQRRRLMKMKLIEMRTDLKTGKIRPFPTERCMAVKQAIYIAAMTIIEKQLQRQGKRQLNEHEAN